MARAFVIRPFDKKKDSAGKEFDFEAIHATVIGPALKDAGLAGSTTGEIIDAGNIREDMFSLILEADLVVCDITILNANVFYELGIRHALRRRRTLIIKHVGSTDSPPFDLLTDRYLAYDLTDPEAKAKLTQAIAATMQSDRSTDSPIFSMLPDLPEADPSVTQLVPLDFRQEVNRARAVKSRGWLRLLAQDIRGRRFERPGLQLVARGQWDLKDYAGARQSLEEITAVVPDNVEANLALANVYERLYREKKEPDPALLARSDEAIDRVLGGPGRLQQGSSRGARPSGPEPEDPVAAGIRRAAVRRGAPVGRDDRVVTQVLRCLSGGVSHRSQPFLVGTGCASDGHGLPRSVGGQRDVEIDVRRRRQG
jgi:hypothetical protein